MDTTVQDPLVGRLLDGRYDVRARLALGGMATVYEALDTRLDRTVALKVMYPHLAANHDFVARFIREAKAAARLSHPNVVGVYDQGADGPHVFLAMEHIAGRTLRDVLVARGRLTPREALEVLEPVLAALAAAHSAGLVHRDVKPENVLLADDGRVKVADFGLARAVAAEAGTTQGFLLGTVAYLSPEQVARGIADPRSDVYAVGIVLFELLTGRKPYEGDNPLQVAQQHVQQDVPPPSSMARDVPPALDLLVRRATSRDPDGRPADAAALLAELVAVRRTLPDPGVTSDPNVTPTVSIPRPDGVNHTLVVPVAGPQREPVPGPGSASAMPGAPRPRRRRRRGLVALLVILLLAAALSGGAWWVGSGPGAFTQAPSLVDQTTSGATTVARRSGLAVAFATEYSEAVDKDHVIRTDPGPGADIRKNGTIRAWLSLGPERHDVPSLAGLTLVQATQALVTAHLTRGEVTTEFSDSVAVGKVLRSVPGTGKPLQRDRSVALVLSNGIQKLAIPVVVGTSADDGEKLLRDAGFEVQRQAEYSRTRPKDDITRQKPATGKVPKGSTVTIWVSQGPPLVNVPHVVGKYLGEARRALEGAGFKVDVRRLPAGPGFVLDQAPNGGHSAPEGSTVTVSVF